MPIELFYVMIALSLFLTVFAQQKRSTLFSLLGFVSWVITAVFPFRIDYLYAFQNTTSGQIIEYTQSYVDAWPLGLLFLGFGFTMMFYWLKLVFGGGGVAA